MATTDNPSATSCRPSLASTARFPRLRTRRGGGSPIERTRKPASVLVVLLLFAAIAWAPATQSELGRAAEHVSSFALVVAAVMGRLWCGVHIAGRKDEELCQSGPYALCRNPLYLFSSLGVLGVIMATHRPLIAGLVFATFWIYHHFIIRAEETRLHGRFGHVFVQYRKNVPRILPKLASPLSPQTFTIVARPLHRSFLEVIWFFAAWLICDRLFASR